MQTLTVYAWGFMMGALAVAVYFDLKVRRYRKKNPGFSFCQRCGCKLWDPDAKRKGDCGVH